MTRMDKTEATALSRWQELPRRARRRVLILLLGLALGLLLLGWCRTLPTAGTGAAETPTASTPGATPEDGQATAAVSGMAGDDRLQQQLEEVLGQIKGAGRVRVAVWYSAGAAAVYATETQEASDRREDGEGEQLSSEQKLTLAAVNDQPVLVRQESASIQGVLVVAEGAGDPVVAERLYAAVRSLLGLKRGQIAIIEGEGSVDQ